MLASLEVKQKELNHEKKIHWGIVSKNEIYEKQIEFYEEQERSFKISKEQNDEKIAKEMQDLKFEVQKK